MLKDKKAVLFDLDGTLVDSMWMWADIDIEFLGRFGYEPPEDLEKAIEGMSFSETAAYFKKRFDLPLTLDEIKDCWIDMAFHKYSHEVKVKPGVLQFLAELKRRGLKTGIATSNGRVLAEAVLKAQGLGDYMDTVTTGCDVNAGKPAPDIYLKTAADLQVEPSDCLVFEDVLMGIRAGLSAGMEVCAVADTFSKADEPEIRTLANYFIKDYCDLAESLSEETL